MSESNAKSGGAPYGLKFLVGLVLAVGGTYASLNLAVPAREELAQKGIPLDLGMTFATIGVLLILMPVMQFFFLNPLQGAIQERNTNLESTFAEAENLRDEMSKMRNDYEKRIAAGEAEARAQIQKQIQDVQNQRAALMEEAARRANAAMAQAEAEIAAERDRLISDLRGHVVDLALAAAEKVIGENMDSEKNRRMIDDFISRAEAVA